MRRSPLACPSVPSNDFVEISLRVEFLSSDNFEAVSVTALPDYSFSSVYFAESLFSESCILSFWAAKTFLQI
jgi:hypothetical protein